MSALPVHDFAPLDEVEYKRQARLLKALHCAYPVQFEGRERFIQVLSSRLAGGRVLMEVYLTGDAVAIDSQRIALQEQAQ